MSANPVGQPNRATQNSTITLFHDELGYRDSSDIDDEIVALGRQLSAEFGRGSDDKSLRHMLKFAEVFPEESIVSALRRQLAWTHFKQIICLDNPLKRDFYAEMCRIEGFKETH